MTSHRETRRKSIWPWIGLLLLVVAASTYAVQRSVTIHVRWKVLPYQTLRFVDGARADAANGYAIPEPSPLDLDRGYIEDENAIRLHVVSNTAWKIQVWVESDDASQDVLIRKHGGTYVVLGTSPTVLASGSHGTYDLGVDYRVSLDDGAFEPSDRPLDIVYTIMSD